MISIVDKLLSRQSRVQLIASHQVMRLLTAEQLQWAAPVWTPQIVHRTIKPTHQGPGMVNSTTAFD